MTDRMPGETGANAGEFTRRQLLAGATTMGIASALTRDASAAIATRHHKPNIIFIMADDLGYADVSCYGRRDYQTPAIDRLAKEGMRFTQAYANSAVCSATRTGLITGRYQNRLPVGLEEPLINRDVGLPPSHPTLPSLLRRAGYTTSLVGKWHLGMLPKFGPLLSGYDHFWGFRGGGVDYFSHEALGNHDLWDDDREVKVPGYLTELLGQQAIKTIRESANKNTPFFMSLHFNAPHFPWEGPDDEAESRRLAAKGDSIEAISHWDGGDMAIYAKMVTAMDQQVGQVLSTLDELDLADDTIVIFTSDNGGERFADTWPFSGRKTELLEGGLRIPAIVRWPNFVPPESVSDQVAMSMDWLPTLLSIAGTQPDPAYPSDGIDLSIALQGGPAVARTVFWRYLNMGQQACRSGDWKYLKILGNSFLFNVVDDPLERANHKDRCPEIYRDLVEKYNAWNAQMLPLDPAAMTSGYTGDKMADHFGIKQRRTIPE